MYANGRGVPEDDVEAVRWYRLACDSGGTLFTKEWLQPDDADTDEDDFQWL